MKIIEKNLEKIPVFSRKIFIFVLGVGKINILYRKAQTPITGEILIFFKMLSIFMNV